MRIIRTISIVTAASAACLLAVYVLMCWRYGGGQPDPSGYQRAFPPRSGLSPALRRDLGWLKNSQKNFFLNRPEAKRSGELRVGVFGDSQVAGAEVGRDEAFPALLQEELRRSGAPRVEVLNFGSKGYGVHQAYMLWKQFGRARGLDVLVLSVEDYHVRRDTTFLATWRLDHPGSLDLHSRFIAEGDALRLVSLPGDTPEEAAARYWSWLPSWTEARYSRDTPLFLRRLLPRGRSLRVNPFYYGSSETEREEAFRTYRIILREMAGSVRDLVVDLGGSEDFAAAFRSRCLAGLPENVTSFRWSRAGVGRTAERLRQQPQGHLSAILHRQKAVELAGFLVGKSRSTLRVYALELDRGPAPAPLPRDLSLGDIQTLSIGTAEQTLAWFHPIPLGRAQPFDLSPRMTKPFDFVVKDYGALVMLDRPDYPFCPLCGGVRDGMPVRVALQAGRRETLVPIGVVQSSVPWLGCAEIDRSALPKTTPMTVQKASLRIGEDAAGRIELAAARGDHRILEDIVDPHLAVAWHLSPGALRRIESAGVAPLRLFLRLQKDGRLILHPLLRLSVSAMRIRIAVPARAILRPAAVR